MKEITTKQQELLHFIMKADEQGIPRLQAFEKYAKLKHLKSETIRNQYYSLVKEFDLTKQFLINSNKPFGKQELTKTMTNIIRLINQGKSIRTACLIESGGDAKLMLRLQNKFRSMLKKDINYLIKLGYNPENKNQKNILFDESMKSQLNLKTNTILYKNDSIKAENDNIPARNNTEPKILKMPNNNLLTDTDINNLFLGLVKMVKRNALENAPKILKNQCEEATNSLKEALMKLGANTRKLEIVKCENFELKKKLLDSQKLLNETQKEYDKLLTKITAIGKIDDLKKFLQDYKRKNKTSKEIEL